MKQDSPLVCSSLAFHVIKIFVPLNGLYSHLHTYTIHNSHTHRYSNCNIPLCWFSLFVKKNFSSTTICTIAGRSVSPSPGCKKSAACIVNVESPDRLWIYEKKGSTKAFSGGKTGRIRSDWFQSLLFWPQLGMVCVYADCDKSQSHLSCKSKHCLIWSAFSFLLVL